MARSYLSQIPCWVFIPWISQVIHLLGHPESPLLDTMAPVFLEISSRYPQAIAYPFSVTVDNIYRNSLQTNQSQQHANFPAGLVRSMAINLDRHFPQRYHFIWAINNMTHP